MNEHNKSLVLIRPTNLSITQIVDKVSKHYSSKTDTASLLPVLAMYSVITIIAREFKQYKDCTVLPLKHRTADSSRKDLIADIHIVDANGSLVEGCDVKHNILIGSDLIQASFEKLRTTSMRKFYILTTCHQNNHAEFETDIQQFAQKHGYQLIVDGVEPILRYSLRLVRNSDEFLDTYVTHLETDPSVTYQMREAWNEIAVP